MKRILVMLSIGILMLAACGNDKSQVQTPV